MAELRAFDGIDGIPALLNYGSVVADGLTNFAGGVTSVGGQFTVAAGADLGLGGPVVSLDAASSVTGAGQVGIGGGSCTVDGVLDVGGGTQVGGSVTFLQSFTPASGNSLGAYLTVGASVAATVTFAEGGDFTLQQLTLDSGTLIGPTDSSASPMQITVTDPGNPSGGLFSVSSSAEFQGRGTLTVAADASTQIDAITFQLDGWTLDDSGPATVSGDTMTGALLGDSQWINRGTLAISTDFYLAGTGSFTNDGTFENEGVNNSVAELRAFDGIDGIPALLNYGSVVADGLTNFAGGVTSVGGQFTVAAGADLGLGGPVVSLDAASSVTGAGEVGIGGGSCTVDGVLDVGGGTQVGGSVTFLQPFTTASGNSLGAFLTVGASVAATATFAEGGDFTLQQLTLDSGTLIGPTDSSASPMQITVTDPGSPSGGLFSVSASGEFQGRGTLTVAADASTQIDANTFQLDGWTLDDSGPATVSGDAISGALLGDSQWINRGTLAISTDFYVAGTGSFTNDGTFNVSGGSTVDFAPVAGVSGVPSFDNEGTVIVQSGNLQLGGAVTSGGSGSGDVRPFTSIAPSLQVDSGATLFLSGTVTTSVVSSISVVGNPPGTVTYFLTGGNGSVQVSPTAVSLADAVTLALFGPSGTQSVSDPITQNVVIGGDGLPLTLDTNGNPVTLTGAVSGGTQNGSPALVKTGSGTLTFDTVQYTADAIAGNIQVTGGAVALAGNTSNLTNTVNVNNSVAGGLVVSGTNQIVGAITGLGSVIVNGGAGLTANSIQQGSLVIGAGSTVTIDSSDAAGNPQVGVDSGQGTVGSGQAAGGTAAVSTAEASATATAAESTIGKRAAATVAAPAIGGMKVDSGAGRSARVLAPVHVALVQGANLAAAETAAVVVSAAPSTQTRITAAIDAALTPALSQREREKMPAAPAIEVTQMAGQATGATGDASVRTAAERANWFAMIGGEFRHESSRAGLFGAAGMVDSHDGVAGVDDALLELLAEGIVGRWGAGG